jgi:hypothetical protein
MVTIPKKLLSLSKPPWVHWIETPHFEGTGSIPLFTEISVPVDLPRRAVYLHVESNLLYLGQSVYYATMNFILRGQVVATELWRQALATTVGDNRPDKRPLSSQQVVFTPMANSITISFPTVTRNLVPYSFNIQCDAIQFVINRQANLSGGTGRFYLACRSQGSV